jgi:peptide/nickel transport system substrate-binding protein
MQTANTTIKSAVVDLFLQGGGKMEKNHYSKFVKKTLTGVFLILVAMLFMVSGIASAAEKKKSLRIGDGFFINSGFALETDDAHTMIRWGLSEPLVYVDFKGKMKPGLATSWRQIDELAWEFKIRSGVKFQNGEDFNADAVANALNHLLNVTAPARAFNSKIVKSVVAKGKDTVIINTNKNDVILTSRMATPNTMILAPSAYKKDGSIDPFGTGTGPFVLKQFVPDQKAVLEKNKNYWKGAVAVDAVEFLWVPDINIRAGMLSSNELDIVRNVPISEIPTMETEENLVIVGRLKARALNVYMNNESGPMSNVKVREAISHAINKELICAAVLEGYGAPLVTSFNSSEAWFADDIKDYSYDVNKAKELLKEAGHDENNPLHVGLWTYVTRPELPPTALAIQGMLSKVNVVAEVRVAPYEALEKSVLDGKYDMFILSRGHLTDGYDPLSFFMADYASAGGYNLNNVSIKEVDDLIAKASVTPDETARWEIYKKIQRVLHKNVVEVNLAQVKDMSAYNKKVKNFTIHPQDWYLATYQLDIEE